MEHASQDALGVGGRAAPRLLLFGGFAGDAVCNDTLAVGADGKGGVSALPPPRPRDAPESRFAHCAAALGDRLFVFGGSGMQGELNDLSVVSVPC